MNILGIETSCDETAVSVVQDGSLVLSSVVASSQAFHAQFGGVLPELASRKQLEFMLPTLTQALYTAFPENQSRSVKELIDLHIDAIAVTVGPGLIGSLLVGVECAKTIAVTTDKPIVPVNHVLAHPYANFLFQPQETLNQVQHDTYIQFPAIALVVSGGHTELYVMASPQQMTWLGGTIDDAAGEAFDKSARLLGLEHGGGKAIEEVALRFTPQKSDQPTLTLPRPLLHDTTLNFSFSGLKTAVQRAWKSDVCSNLATQERQQLFAYQIQEAIVDVLVAKTLKAAAMHNARSILLGGGVSANQRLRTQLSRLAKDKNLACHFPAVEYCTDNATAIASYAYFHFSPHNYREITATPSLSVEI